MSDVPEPDADLARIEQGGIPLAAELRLQRSEPFSSGLSVGSFALCHRLGLTPLAQVMGSSVYQVGYQSAIWPATLGGEVIAELSTLSQAWNEVRERALRRLALEARAAGADAVVGVTRSTGAYDWALGAIEYAALGTAVRREGARASEPVLTELSVADYAKLLEAGVEPLGIVAWTAVFLASYGGGGWLGQGAMPLTSNYELRELTQGVYAAREQVISQVSAQARRLGADGVIGVHVGHRVERRESAAGQGGRAAGFVITFDAVGTAVREAAGAQPRQPLMTIDMAEGDMT